MSETETLGIRDVKVVLERTFPGTVVNIPPSMSGSYHAEISFLEYEIRIILVGNRARDRKMHFRFMQKFLLTPDDKRLTKRMIREFETQDPDVLLQAIEDAKAYLLGLVFSIQRALKPVPVPKTSNILDGDV